MKIDALYEKLTKRIEISSSGCWNWQGAITNTTGYGSILWMRKVIPTHRAMFLATKGFLPEKSFICHSCDNRRCINPDHLFEASAKENTHDMIKKNRHSHGPGHALAIQNGWTPEKRETRANQTRARMEMIHNLLAKEAGVPEDWKYCPFCKQWKPRTDFYKNSARHDKLKSYCKPCDISKEVARRKNK